MMNPFRTRSPRGRRLREFALAMPLAAVLIYFGLRAVAGENGLARIADDEIAVVCDHLSERTSVVFDPGFRLFLPWFQEVVKFDKSPIEYRMQGSGPMNALRAPQLTVRANDGSSFYFESFTLHYAILPERGAQLLEESGPGERFKTTIVNSFARSVLRDEFGRYSAEEIVEPDNLHTATRRSQERLNELLAPHSLVVLEITTPKPRFDEEYEKAIERRKIADQMIQHQRSKRVQLEQEKIQREERAYKEKEIERRNVQSELAQQKLSVEREKERVRADAEIFARELLLSGSLHLAQARLRAAALTQQYTLDAAGMKSRLAALEARGESVVRAALIAKLSSIEFSILPYTRDSTPQRMEYEQETIPAKGKK